MAKRSRIMVVEDEAIVALDIQGKLEALGYDVAAVCGRGDEAVEQAGIVHPDLVLMDIRLEGEMDGVAAAEQIRRQQDLPVVFLTAYSDDATLERAKVTEPFGYLLKPFEERELRTTIEVVLYKRAAEAEKARLEESLRQARKMEAIGQLTARFAHSFNNMLQGVIGNLDLAMETADDAARPFLEDASFDAERAARLVRQLTLLYRQERAEHQIVRLLDLVEEVAERCRQVFDRRIPIHVEADPAGVPSVVGHPEHLRQLLVNLCTNARDAVTPHLGDGGRAPSIRIRVEQADAGPDRAPAAGRFVRLSVTDNGVGMDTETCSHAFEPFFTTKKAGGNSGLGLSMVYGIAADHQGWTECESALGAGTTVSVFFPATADRDATGARPAPQPASAAEPPVGAEQLRGSETILVIADVDRFRGVLDLMLERSGYASLLGRGARDGLEVYRHQHRQIDLVVIGLSTPEMSVQEVLAGLRRIDPAVRALVLTGQDPDEPSWSGTAALGKPFNTAQLLRAVRRCLDG